MSQYQPPQQPAPGAPAPQPSPFAQPPQPGYGQPQQAFGQASQPPPPGYQGQPSYQSPAEPGLFDTTFAKPTTPKVAKTAYLAVMLLAGALVLVGMLQAIGQIANAVEFSGFGSGASSLLYGIGTLVFYPAVGFVVLTVGRLVIEYFVEEYRAREARKGS